MAVTTTTKTPSTSTSLDAAWRALAGQSDSRAPASFTIKREGRPSILVSYATDSDDDVLSVTFSTVYDEATRHRRDAVGVGAVREGYRDRPPIAPIVATRPLEIELRREGAGDEHAKSTGLSVEWQSGDRQFDDAVYVTSPISASDESNVLGSVLNADVRSGVSELLKLAFGSVSIDVGVTGRGRIEALISAGRWKAGEAELKMNLDERAVRMVAAFDRILDNVPVLTHSGKKRPRAPLATLTTVLGIIGVAGWLLNVGYVGLLSMLLDLIHPRLHVSEDIPTMPIIGAIVLGIFGGLVGASLYGKVVAYRMRGRADAHVQVGGAKLRAFGGFSVITFTIAFAIVFIGFAPR